LKRKARPKASEFPRDDNFCTVFVERAERKPKKNNEKAEYEVEIVCDVTKLPQKPSDGKKYELAMKKASESDRLRLRQCR
jgi:hypothetical protein